MSQVIFRHICPRVLNNRSAGINATTLRFKSKESSSDEDKLIESSPKDDQLPMKDEFSGSGGPKSLYRLKESSVIDDDRPEVPKKHIFQQLKRKRLTESVYTIEEAAAPHPEPSGRHIRWKYPTIAELTGTYEYALRSHDNKYSFVFQWPDLTDLLIIGGGLVGAATAYYAKKVCNRVGDVVVIDKDPYSPHNCTAFSNGLISVQSKSQDITRMSYLSKELIRNLKRDVVVTAEDFDQVNYRPCTHLILWPDYEVDEVMKSVSRQMEDGCFTEAKLPEELEATFPWLKAAGTDIALGTHGNQDEAIVDPIGLRNLYRTLAQAHGVHFIQAEAIDFNTPYDIRYPEINPLSEGTIVARISTKELKQVNTSKILMSLGHNVPFLEAKAELEPFRREGLGDLHFLQPKLRIYFTFQSMSTPILNFPVITDTDGTMLVREDLAGTFKYYLTLEESSKLFEEDTEKFMDLESDDPFVNLYHKGEQFKKYFEQVIKPRIVNRIPLMSDAEFIIAASGFENYNTFDGSPVLGLHPYHEKIILSGGYGNRLTTYGPVAGAALSELMLFHEEEHFDVTNFYWNRVHTNRPIDEFKSLLG